MLEQALHFLPGELPLLASPGLSAEDNSDALFLRRAVSVFHKFHSPHDTDQHVVQLAKETQDCPVPTGSDGCASIG